MSAPKRPRSKFPRPSCAALAAVSVATLLGGCASEPCPPEEGCSPQFVVRGYPTMGFPDGNYRITVEMDGETTECTTALPADLPEVVVCGDVRVTYRRETICEQTERDDNLSVRCSDVGDWRQSIWVDEGPDSVNVHVVFPDGRESEESFSPEYEDADPYRVNCSECPRTELRMDLP